MISKSHLEILNHSDDESKSHILNSVLNYFRNLQNAVIIKVSTLLVTSSELPFICKRLQFVNKKQITYLQTHALQNKQIEGHNNSELTFMYFYVMCNWLLLTNGNPL